MNKSRLKNNRNTRRKKPKVRLGKLGDWHESHMLHKPLLFIEKSLDDEHTFNLYIHFTHAPNEEVSIEDLGVGESSDCRNIELTVVRNNERPRSKRNIISCKILEISDKVDDEEIVKVIVTYEKDPPMGGGVTNSVNYPPPPSVGLP